MVEQAHAGEGHGNAVLIAGFDNMVVAHAAAGLCYVGHAALMRPLDIVAEGEESVRT